MLPLPRNRTNVLWCGVWIMFAALLFVYVASSGHAIDPAPQSNTQLRSPRPLVESAVEHDGLQARSKAEGGPVDGSNLFELETEDKLLAELTQYDANEITDRDPPQVPCVLSNYARQVDLATKFLLICSGGCFPAFLNDTERKGTKLPPRRPDFCRNATQVKNPVFDFSLPAHSEPIFPKRLPLILSAIGTRFYGPGGQSYVFDAIQQWRLFHPAFFSPIYLLVDKAMAKDPKVRNATKHFSVKLVTQQDLITPQWRKFWNVFYVQGYMHPGGTRTTGHKRFNLHITERFFAIQSLMAKEGLEHVVHMENDIMVYENLWPRMRAAAECGHQLASTIPHTKGVIPSVIYIRNSAAMLHLCNFINDVLSCGKHFGELLQHGYANDMTYLMNYYQYYGSKYMGVLPSWEHKDGENCVADRTMKGKKDRPQYMFDAASFGQWLSFSVGKDRPPKHIRDSMKGRFVDATPPPDVVWVEDEKGRRVPTWKQFKLSTLHIHAKNLEYFRSVGWQPQPSAK